MTRNATAGKFRVFTSSLLALTLALVGLVFAQPAQAQFRSTFGTEFWVNFDRGLVQTSAPAIFIASPGAGTAEVTWPSGNVESVTLVAGQAVTVDATAEIKTPDNYVDADDGIDEVAVKITSDTPVAVYMSNKIQYASEASIAYPTTYLGTTYRVAAYQSGARFSVTAVESGTTTVDITMSANFSGSVLRSAAENFQVTLTEGQTYSLTGNNITGTLIESDQKVSVSASNGCVGVDIGACDHLTEYMPPVETWGKSFILPSSRNEDNTDHFYILANEDGTEVVLNGDTANPIALDAGELHDFYKGRLSALTNNFDTAESNKPILILQISTGGTYRADDNTTTNGDPAALVVQPTVQFLNDAIISTPATGFDVNYVTIVAKNEDVAAGAVKVDGTAIASGRFTAAGSTGYSIARVDITVGSHRVTSTNGFAAYVSGFGYYDAYSYSGGSGLVDLVTYPGGVPEVGYQTVEQIVQGGSSAPPASVAPVYNGPLLVNFSTRNLTPCSLQEVTIGGFRLAGITSVTLQGKEVAILQKTSTELSLSFPAGLAPRQDVDLIVRSDSGLLTVQDAFDVSDTACAESLSKGIWTTLQPDGKTVKMYAKDPIGDGKIQFFVDGKEIAWINAVDESDPKLSFASSTPYLVRSVELNAGKNRFEIKLDGTRVWRATYVPKG